jgi:acetyl-CoA carboxylase carboxyl transferase subunit beta
VSWFKKEKKKIQSSEQKHVRTEGLWSKCESCRQIIWKKDLETNCNVCPRCNFHFKVDARTRLRLLFDGEWVEYDMNLSSNDPLQFNDLKSYKERLAVTQKKTGLVDAIVQAEGTIGGRGVIICSMEYAFQGGSMGAVVGEVITRAIERCIDKGIPLIIVSASGGARMQEGAVSLMQLAKISAALANLDDARLPYISVLTDPTTGGTTASFAMLGDLNIGEPGALIGFAGPRVIEQTIRQKLPPGFQRSEFLLEHGFLDAVVSRKDMKNYIIKALDFCCAQSAGAPPHKLAAAGD